MTATSTLVDRLQELAAAMTEDNPYRADLLEAADRLAEPRPDRPCPHLRPASRPRLPMVAEVVGAAARACGTIAPELHERTRAAAVVLARVVGIYLLRRLLGISYPDSADAVGMRSHTSAIAAWHRAEEAQARGDSRFTAAVERAEEELRSILA